jgi:hypothetical protein
MEKRRKPLGTVQPLTDEQLDTLSQVTPQDIEDAKGLWAAGVGGWYASLLDAEIEEPDINNASQ